jgi:hypothetical protein
MSSLFHEAVNVFFMTAMAYDSSPDTLRQSSFLYKSSSRISHSVAKGLI